MEHRHGLAAALTQRRRHRECRGQRNCAPKRVANSFRNALAIRVRLRQWGHNGVPQGLRIGFSNRHRRRESLAERRAVWQRLALGKQYSFFVASALEKRWRGFAQFGRVALPRAQQQRLWKLPRGGKRLARGRSVFNRAADRNGGAISLCDLARLQLALVLSARHRAALKKPNSFAARAQRHTLSSALTEW